uniref:transposase family protein n=1 Tax=Salipaludibacillus agaradhaerens TaxID=76935 RepID=UPI00147384A4
MYKHGKKEQLFVDLPMHAKRVGIYVKRQRYKCRECNGTFFEDLPIRKTNRQNVSAKERRQLMRVLYVLLTRRKDLNDFDDQIKLQIWTDVSIAGSSIRVKRAIL